jgi:hypothetical protein
MKREREGTPTMIVTVTLTIGNSLPPPKNGKIIKNKKTKTAHKKKGKENKRGTAVLRWL